MLAHLATIEYGPLQPGQEPRYFAAESFIRKRYPHYFATSTSSQTEASPLIAAVIGAAPGEASYIALAQDRSQNEARRYNISTLYLGPSSSPLQSASSMAASEGGISTDGTVQLQLEQIEAFYRDVALGERQSLAAAQLPSGTIDVSISSDHRYVRGKDFRTHLGDLLLHVTTLDIHVDTSDTWQPYAFEAVIFTQNEISGADEKQCDLKLMDQSNDVSADAPKSWRDIDIKCSILGDKLDVPAP